MTPAALGAICAAIAVPIVMAILAKALPPSGAVRSTRSLEDLKPIFTKWEVGLAFIYMGLWGPITGAIWLPLQAASGLVARSLGPAEIRIIPGAVFWLIPALFLALAVASLPTTWIAKRLLGERFNDYEAYLQLKHNIDYRRANRLALIVIVWLVAVTIGLGLNWYVLVRTDAFVVNPLFGLREIVHPYNDIQGIQTAPELIAPNGNTVRRREFLIKFRDNSTWSTSDLPAEMPLSEKRSMLETISERSGKSIEDIRVFAKWVL